MMYIPNQLIGAPVNTQVTMECTTEASPKVSQNLPHLSQICLCLPGRQPLDLILPNKMHKSFLASDISDLIYLVVCYIKV